MSGRDIEKAREIDDNDHLDEEQKLMMAFQRFVNSIADTRGDTDVGMVEATYLALDELENQAVIGNDHLVDEVEETREIAEDAVLLAQSDRDGENKAQRARDLTRNELVRRYVTGTGHTTTAITNSKVQELGRPEHDLTWQTVDRQFDKLESKWDAFTRTTDDGEDALTISGGLSDKLARKVSVELDRPDIANTVVGEKGGEA